VLAITTFTDEADAVAKANDTEFGLVSYAFTRDLARGQRLIESLKTGMTGINVGVVSNASAPFGGVKHSGPGGRACARPSPGAVAISYPP